MGIELQANAKTENKAWSDKTPFTANHVSHRKREKRAKESSGWKNGYLLKQVRWNRGVGASQRKERLFGMH